MNIRIKKVQNEDREAALEFLALENLKLVLELNPEIKKLYEGQLHEMLVSSYIMSFKERIEEEGSLYSAYLEEKIVGAGFIDLKGYLNYLYVKEEYQHQQIGTQLLKHLIEDCNQMQVIRVDARITAISLYERFSFHRVNGPSNEAFVPMELERCNYGK